MEKTDITFDKLPEAVAFLIEQITALHALVELIPKTPPTERRPIEIDDACRLIRKARSTVYTLVRKGQIPCYKNGNKLYFYEDELLAWIKGGRKMNLTETRADIEARMQAGIRHKPSKRNIF